MHGRRPGGNPAIPMLLWMSRSAGPPVGGADSFAPKNDQRSKNWASGRRELPEHSTIVRGRPVSAAPVVTQLVTQPEGRTLDQDRDLFGRMTLSFDPLVYVFIEDGCLFVACQDLGPRFLGPVHEVIRVLH